MKFLVAAADPALSLILEQAAIRWRRNVVAVDDGESAWRELTTSGDEEWLVLADLALPRVNGLTLCETLRQASAGERCYFILVVSSHAPFDVDAAVRAGVDDVIVRPFEPGLLDLRIRIAQTIVSLRARARAAEDAVREQATTDTATGTLNRAAIVGFVERERTRAARDATPMAVLAVQVDDLPRIGEWHGVATREEVMAETARRVKGLLRAYDGLGRSGDDEFLVVLPMCDATRAGGVAARIRNHVATEPVQAPERSVGVTVSVGVALGGSATEHPVEDLPAAASRAARRAHDAGGNRVELAGPPELAAS